MARLTQDVSAHLEITPVDYEQPYLDMPRTNGEFWDANWLIVRIGVNTGTREWTATGPALTTFEIERLIAWLRRVAAGDATTGGWGSTVEDCLRFTVRPAGAQIELTALFNDRFFPPEEWNAKAWSTWVPAIFTVAPATIAAFARMLADDLAAFPVRGGADRSSRPIRADA